MPVKPDAPESGVGAVDRALSVLFAFEAGEETLTLAELARRTGLYKSTLLRLIASLERVRMVLREDGAARWRLGPALVLLGARAGPVPVRALVPPALRRLAEETGENASFYVRHGEARLCLLREEGRHPVRDNLVPGSLLPLDRGAAGHVLRDNRDGLVVTLGERDPEMAALAAPVRGADGELLGALCLSGTVTRLRDEARRAPMEAALLREAAALSGMLGNGRG
ncbi:IclR family transcriptional regulator [Teichococcus oryzae]|uniref:Helix-turn-helix domain-containing protein n=1 Tax=Teichococcus oryzae TaxID=1608942 RepID=A0A5B2TDH6_9PROT|nr:helix-turn-helix domain-containing protein [Pseudoroseomonas oryzae]KAA2211850.1 helix-turn-helix domain-containing protein [Pseudoroseomonas oryzae]